MYLARSGCGVSARVERRLSKQVPQPLRGETRARIDRPDRHPEDFRDAFAREVADAQQNKCEPLLVREMRKCRKRARGPYARLGREILPLAIDALPTWP